ncbi:hypothetical protein GCM10020255_019120 [Rhodococcus baikonurensis]
MKILVIMVFVGAVLAGLSFWGVNRWLAHKSGNTVKTPKRRTDRQRLGIRYAEDGLFLIGNGAWTGVILPGNSDDFTSGTQQEFAFDRSTDFYKQLLMWVEAEQGRDASLICHELVRYQPVDTSRWEDELDRAMWDPSKMFQTLTAKRWHHTFRRPRQSHGAC